MSANENPSRMRSVARRVTDTASGAIDELRDLMMQVAAIGPTLPQGTEHIVTVQARLPAEAHAESEEGDRA